MYVSAHSVLLRGGSRKFLQGGQVSVASVMPSTYKIISKVEKNEVSFKPTSKYNILHIN